MFGCQQVLIKADKDTRAIIEYLCRESNSLYNCSVYYARQIWFKTGKIVTGFDLTKEMKSNPHFRAGYASSMQQTCLNVGESFKSFKQWYDIILASILLISNLLLFPVLFPVPFFQY